MTAPSGLQLDLLTVIARLEQIRDEDDAELTLERVLTCDLPRLRSHLTPETLAWEREPAAEPEPEGERCRSFRWIGQPFTSCDGCGRPVWEHDGWWGLKPGAKVGDPDGMEHQPFEPGYAEKTRRAWEGPPGQEEAQP